MRMSGLILAQVLKQCLAGRKGYVLAIHYCIINYPKIQRLKTTINIYHLTQV